MQNIKNETIAIFFAAGKGSRLMPLTTYVPKPLAIAGGVRLIHHTIASVDCIIKPSKIIIVVNYLSELIIQALGNTTVKGTPIEFVHQTSPKGGTLDALRSAINYLAPTIEATKNSIRYNFIVTNSDDLCGSDIFHSLANSINGTPDQALIAGYVVDDNEKIKNFGVIETDGKNNMTKIWEKPQTFISSLASVGLLYLPSVITKYIPPKPEGDNNGREEYITDGLLNKYIQDYTIKVIKFADTGEVPAWMPISGLADLKVVDSILNNSHNNESDKLVFDYKVNFKEKIIQEIVQIPFGKVTSYGKIGTKVGLSGFFVGKILSSLSPAECEHLPWARVVRADGYLSSLKLGYKGIVQREILISEGVKFADKKDHDGEGVVMSIVIVLLKNRNCYYL